MRLMKIVTLENGTNNGRAPSAQYAQVELWFDPKLVYQIESFKIVDLEYTIARLAGVGNSYLIKESPSEFLKRLEEF